MTVASLGIVRSSAELFSIPVAAADVSSFRYCIVWLLLLLSAPTAENVWAFGQAALTDVVHVMSEAPLTRISPVRLAV